MAKQTKQKIPERIIPYVDADAIRDNVRLNGAQGITLLEPTPSSKRTDLYRFEKRSIMVDRKDEGGAVVQVYPPVVQVYPPRDTSLQLIGRFLVRARGAAS